MSFGVVMAFQLPQLLALSRHTINNRSLVSMNCFKWSRSLLDDVLFRRTTHCESSTRFAPSLSSSVYQAVVILTGRKEVVTDCVPHENSSGSTCRALCIGCLWEEVSLTQAR